MKNKPTQIKSKPNLLRDVIFAVILVLAGAGYVYFNEVEIPFLKKNPTKLRIYVFVSSSAIEQQVAPKVETFRKDMEAKGFDLKFSYATPTSERSQVDNLKWDIALANSVNALVNIRKNAAFTVIGARNNCSIGTRFMVPESSGITDLQQLENKKVYIFSKGTINPLLLKTASEFKDLHFEVIDDENLMAEKIKNEPEFVLLTNYQTLEKNNEQQGMKDLFVTPFKLPCRFLLASNKVPKAIVTKFMQNADFSSESLLNGYEVMGQEKFDTLFASFPWKDINKLRIELLKKQ